MQEALSIRWLPWLAGGAMALALSFTAPRAAACGACVCFEHEWVRPFGGEVPLNARWIVDAAAGADLGEPLDPTALRLRRRSDGGAVPFVLEPLGTGTQLYWLIPSALDPGTFYDLDVEGTDYLATFVTRDAADHDAPVVDVAIDTAAPDTCVDHVGARLVITPGSVDPIADAGTDASSWSTDAGTDASSWGTDAGTDARVSSIDGGTDAPAGSAASDTAAVQLDVAMPGGVQRSIVLLPTPGVSTQSLAFGSTLDPAQPVADCLGPAELAGGAVGVVYPAHVRAFDFAGNVTDLGDVVFELEPAAAAACGPLDGGFLVDDTPDAGLYGDPLYGTNMADDTVPRSSGSGCACRATHEAPSSPPVAVLALAALAIRTRRRGARRPRGRRERRPG